MKVFKVSHHSCPKSDFILKAGWRDVLVAAYYGPEAGQPKGQNVAVSEARDGEANEAERICRLPADGHENGNLESKETIFMF